MGGVLLVACRAATQSSAKTCQNSPESRSSTELRDHTRPLTARLASGRGLAPRVPTRCPGQGRLESRALDHGTNRATICSVNPTTITIKALRATRAVLATLVSNA